MAQNENISISLANKVDILNKSQSVDARYGVYDEESDALDAMALYGADGRQVAVYTDKPNGKVRLYLYNEVLHQLEPISGVEVEWDEITGDQSDVNISGFTNDSGFTTNDGTVTSVSITVPTGLQVTGSPVTASGTLAVTYASGYQGYTTDEANKLLGIADGAEVNVNADWNSNSGDSQILNKPTIPTKTSDLINDGADDTSTYVEFDDLASVATSNDYNDLDNLPNSGDIGYSNTTSGLDATNVQDAIDEIEEQVLEVLEGYISEGEDSDETIKYLSVKEEIGEELETIYFVPKIHQCVKSGQLLIFKSDGNSDKEPEENDLVEGFMVDSEMNDWFIRGIYSGTGDFFTKESYTPLNGSYIIE